MAKIDFPNSPSDGDIISSSSADFVYSSSKNNWKAVSTVTKADLASITVSTAGTPSGSGDLAYNGVTGSLTYTQPDIPAGHSTTVYANASDLPLSGNDTGDQAYVTSTNRLYIWNGAGWYNIALVNVTPTITTGSDATYSLATDGSATTITLAATDPDGEALTWGYAVTTGSLGSTATVSQADNVFTVTPSTDSANAGTFSLTFTVTNGINKNTSTSAFTLEFSLDYTGITTASFANFGEVYSVSSGDRKAYQLCWNDTHFAAGIYEPGQLSLKVTLNLYDGTNVKTFYPHQVGDSGTQYWNNLISLDGNYLTCSSPKDNWTQVYDIRNISQADHGLVGTRYNDSTLASSSVLNDTTVITFHEEGTSRKVSSIKKRNLSDWSVVNTYSTISSGNLQWKIFGDKVLFTDGDISEVFDLTNWTSLYSHSAAALYSAGTIPNAASGSWGHQSSIVGDKLIYMSNNSGGSVSVHIFDSTNGNYIKSLEEPGIDKGNFLANGSGGNERHGGINMIGDSIVACWGRYTSSNTVRVKEFFVWSYSSGQLVHTVEGYNKNRFAGGSVNDDGGHSNAALNDGTLLLTGCIENEAPAQFRMASPT